MGPQERTEENERAVCDGVRGKRRAKRRTERAEASARSFPFRGRQGGRKGGGGANSRDINSVLALGGLHRRKLRAEGESIPFLPAANVYPSLRRSPFLPLLPSPPPPSLTDASSNATTLDARGWGGVTNQRLAIVNSTCAVKQLINKRLFTSCTHGVLARTQREHIFPPRDDECGADNAADRWTTSGSSGIKIKKCLSLYSEIASTDW